MGTTAPPSFQPGTVGPNTSGLGPEQAGMYTEGYFPDGYWSRASVVAEARLGTAATAATAIQTRLHAFVGLLGLDEGIGTSAIGRGVI